MSIYVEDINTVYITGGGYVREAFTGLGRDSMGWNEVVWGGKLNRSNTFALENIDDVDIGQIPQCTLVFKYMKIEDFIKIQSLLKERHLIVDYFDFDLGKRVVHEMAITGNERKKFYSMKNYVNGVCDFTIKLVGTNRDDEMLQKCTITYDSNGGSGTISNNNVGKYYNKDDGKWYVYSEQVKLNSGEGFSKQGYHLKEWNTKADGTGATYGLSQSITLWQSLVLYAIWE